MSLNGSKKDFLNIKKVKSLSHVRLFATPWTIAYQAPLSMEFSRQEYWSGLPFPGKIQEGAQAIMDQALESNKSVFESWLCPLKAVYS